MSLFKTSRTNNYSKPRKPKNKKQSEDKIIKVIEDRIIRDTRNLFGQEKQDYYKPVRVSSFWSNNCTEYETNGNRTKILSIKGYLDEIERHLKDIINNLKKFDAWKIPLTIANNLVFSENMNGEREMHSQSDNV